MDNNESRLRENILTYLKDDSVLLDFIDELEDNYDIVLFGGVVRDYLLYHRINPRDMDFVICQRNSKNVLERLIYSYFTMEEIRINRFSGYKIERRNTNLDIWLLEDTWAFKNGLLKTSIKNLLESVYLNIDAYAYNFTAGKYVNNCDQKKLPETIDVLFDKNPDIDLNLVRAIVLAKKYNINLSKRIKDIIIKRFREEDSFLSKIKTIEEEHYGRICFDSDDLNKMIGERV